MLNRLNELNVVIGIFFLLLAVILLLGSLISPALAHPANTRAGIAFGIFGVIMLLIRGGYAEEKQSVD